MGDTNSLKLCRGVFCNVSTLIIFTKLCYIVFGVFIEEVMIENYFDVIANDDIRIKGHRIGIEDVIKYYLQGYSPEEILTELPTLNLEKIYATLTYYHQNKQKINQYLFELEQKREQHYQQWLSKSSPLIERLKQAKIKQIQEKVV